MQQLTGQAFIENMSAAELARAQRVESVLPALAQQAAAVDAEGSDESPINMKASLFD